MYLKKYIVILLCAMRPDEVTDVTGAAAASTGAEPTAEAGQETASSGDSEFGSPQPGSEFSPEQPMEGDLGGDDFDFGQTGTTAILHGTRAQIMHLP